MGATPGAIQVSLVTNIPVPYRIPVYELLDADEVDLTVVYTADRERNRHWVLPATTVRSIVLRSLVMEVRGKYIHFTPGVWAALRRSRPEVVITTGFNPPQLLAIAFCLTHRIPHIVQTDGTQQSEAILTPAHRIIRRLTARRSAAFVVASHSGADLVRSWGAESASIYRSPLAVDNLRFSTGPEPERDIDLLFSGQLSAVKNPLFALEVARRAAQHLGRRVRLTFIGTGPLLAQLEEAAQQVADDVDAEFAGFQQQDTLPDWYRRSRVFLFPTTWDPWGLVGNEAAAAGTPQVSSPHAGSAAELVGRGGAGFIEPLVADRWKDRAVELLTDDVLWTATSSAARQAVADLTYDAAESGLRLAILQAAGR